MQWNAAYFTPFLSQWVMSQTVWLMKRTHLQYLQTFWGRLLSGRMFGKGWTCATFVPIHDHVKKGHSFLPQPQCLTQVRSDFYSVHTDPGSLRPPFLLSYSSKMPPSITTFFLRLALFTLKKKHNPQIWCNMRRATDSSGWNTQF